MMILLLKNPKTLKMEITKMGITMVAFEKLSTDEKLAYIKEMLMCIKPDCFDEGESKKEEPKMALGDFYVRLDKADKFDFNEYNCEDFIIKYAFEDPTHDKMSADADSYCILYPYIFEYPTKADSWCCGSDWTKPEWFKQEMIDKGHIWVKPLVVHKEV